MSILEKATGNKQSIIEKACGNEAVKDALNQLMSKEKAVRDLSGKSQEEMKDIVKEIITRNKDSVTKTILSEKPSLREIAEEEGLSEEEVINRILDFSADVASSLMYRKVQKVQKGS